MILAHPRNVDCHCHVIPAGMLTSAVPDDWRPALSVADGRQVVSFRGNQLNSVTGEFADVSVMLDQAEAAGVSHLLLSPWVKLLPVQAELALARRICRIQNESLTAATANHPDGRVLALGAVPLQNPEAAAAELAYLMTLPGLRGGGVPPSVAGPYLGGAG